MDIIHISYYVDDPLNDEVNFAVLDVSFNSGYCTDIINDSFCTLIFAVFFCYILHARISTWFILLERTRRTKYNGKANKCLVWWCNSLIKVEIYMFTKFRCDRSICGWDTTTYGFWKQRGSQNLKVGHLTAPLDPFDLICTSLFRTPGPLAETRSKSVINYKSI